MALKTKAFDASKYIETDADQKDLLMDALESGDAGYIANALGVIAKARGMSDLARKTGISRQALYNALGPDGNPTLDTVVKVIAALGIKLTVESPPVHEPVPHRFHFLPASLGNHDPEMSNYMVAMGYPTKEEAAAGARETISQGGYMMPAVVKLGGFNDHFMTAINAIDRAVVTTGYVVAGPNRTEGGSPAKPPAKRAKKQTAHASGGE